MEVNKTIYGNNEDVPGKILDVFHTDSRLRDVAFAVVWNVLVVGENDSVNQLSTN